MRMISSLRHLVDMKSSQILNVSFILVEVFICGVCLAHQWLGKLTNILCLRYFVT